MLIPKARLPLAHMVLYGWLPSGVKAWAYRAFRGYKIGENVKMGFGSVIVGQDVQIADHVEIGVFAVVIGRKVSIGKRSTIGTMSYVQCETIEMGEEARIREQVYVGGPMLPESRFTLGSRTIVLQQAYINPTKPVEIGDDSGIGGHCLIFTHGAWLNALEGYPVNYAPVTIGRSVWLPWRVFVMPGASIGDGSVIGANSLVTGDIPASSLAVGSPAKVVRSAPDFPKRLSAEERSAILEQAMDEFDRWAEYNGVKVGREGLHRTYSRAGRIYRLMWEHGTVPNTAVVGRADTVLSETTIGDVERSRYRERGVHWLDLASKERSDDGSDLTEEIATFLGRYGIRLVRVP